MKKFLLIGLLFFSACQSAQQTPSAAPTQLPTETAPAPTPTVMPVTDTPAPTLTPAPTPTPFPRFFTDEFDASSPSWSLVQSGSEVVPGIRNENGALILQIDAPFTWAYSIYEAQEYQDIHVEARFANQGGSPASVGLVCRYTESEGWFEYNVMTDGTYNVLYGEWLAAGIADYLPVLSASSNAIQPSGTSQEIGLVCSGTTLSLFIDQNLIRTVDVSRFELAGGRVGLTVSSFENTPVIAAFDWIRVSQP